jgi:hypothetical protein
VKLLLWKCEQIWEVKWTLGHSFSWIINCHVNLNSTNFLHIQIRTYQITITNWNYIYVNGTMFKDVNFIITDSSHLVRNISF